MIDKAKLKQFDHDNFRTEKRTTDFKVSERRTSDFKVPDRRRSGIKQELKTERRHSNMNLMRTVNS